MERLPGDDLWCFLLQPLGELRVAPGALALDQRRGIGDFGAETEAEATERMMVYRLVNEPHGELCTFVESERFAQSENRVAMDPFFGFATGRPSSVLLAIDGVFHREAILRVIGFRLGKLHRLRRCGAVTRLDFEFDFTHRKIAVVIATGAFAGKLVVGDGFQLQVGQPGQRTLELDGVDIGLGGFVGDAKRTVGHLLGLGTAFRNESGAGGDEPLGFQFDRETINQGALQRGDLLQSLLALQSDAGIGEFQFRLVRIVHQT